MKKPHSAPHPSTVANLFLSIIFIAAIFTPSFDGLFLRLSSKMASTENRNMAKKPAVFLRDWSSILDFPKAYESYFNDNFGFRNLMVRWNAYLKLKYLQISPSPLVLVGKDGWLYYHGDNAYDGFPIKNYTGLAQYSERNLQSIKNNLERQKKWLDSRGIRYVVLIAPDKPTIYPEYMPDAIKVVNTRSRTDQLIEYLKTSGSQMQILDVREELRRAKNLYPVYYKTDHHWTRVGAFLAVQAIVKELSVHFEGLKPLQLSDYEVTVQKLKDETDLANMLAMPGMLDDTDVIFRLKAEAAAKSEASKKTAPTVLVFHESFFTAMREFALHHFKSVSQARWQPFGVLDYKLIEKTRPDVVILEIEESYQGALQ